MKRYLKNRIEPLVSLYGEENLHLMEEVLSSFYQLDDGGREDVLKIVKILTERHLEEKGVEEIKDLGKRK